MLLFGILEGINKGASCFIVKPFVDDNVIRTVNRLSAEIIKKDQWILEGVYYRWLDGSFQRADAIIILKTPLFIRNWRLIVRFIKRKLGIISSKKESISDCISLIKWNNNFDSDNLVRINSHIQKYGTKINEIRTKRQLKRFIENISKGE